MNDIIHNQHGKMEHYGLIIIISSRTINNKTCSILYLKCPLKGQTTAKSDRNQELVYYLNFNMSVTSLNPFSVVSNRFMLYQKRVEDKR